MNITSKQNKSKRVKLSENQQKRLSPKLRTAFSDILIVLLFHYFAMNDCTI